MFDGELGTKIPVTFRPLGPLLWGRTISGPGSVAGKKSRIAVEISESLVGYAEVAPQYIWGTLIHELLHAYALVMARRNGMCRCGYRVAHGPGFLAAAVAAVKVLEIEAIGMDSLVGSQEEGLCHSDHDEIVLQAVLRRREEEDGECTLDEEDEGCTLDEEAQRAMLSWWDHWDGV